MLSNQFESGNEDEDDDDNGHPVQQDFNQLGNEKDEGQPDGADANQYQVYFYDSKDMVRALFHCSLFLSFGFGMAN